MKNPKVQGRKESIISRELTLILIKEIDDVILKAVSISEVRLINDNELAKIYYSFIAFSNQTINQNIVQTHLEEKKNLIRKLLARKLEMRKVPDLTFVYDDSLDRANRIDQILADK